MIIFYIKRQEDYCLINEDIETVMKICLYSLNENLKHLILLKIDPINIIEQKQEIEQ
jgi:hypothetical protein